MAKRPRLRAYGYARISRDDQAQGFGVERQTADIIALAKREGCDLVEVYVDNDMGASRYSKKVRHEWKRMLADAVAGADAVLVWDMSRLTRLPRELEDLIDMADPDVHGIRVMAQNGDLHLDTGEGRFFARMLVNQAAKEADDTSKRVRRQQEQARANGRRHGGRRRLYGYTRDMRVRDDEAKVVREMVQRATAGHAAQAIARWANAEGHRTSTGSPWQGRTVAHVIRNPAISGQVGHMTVVKGTKGRYATAVVGGGNWQAIVTPEARQAAVAALAMLAQPRDTGGSPTIFSGLIVCECGAVMTRSTAGTKGPGGVKRMYKVWRCRPDRGCGHNQITAQCEDTLLAMVADMLDQSRANPRRREEHVPVMRTAEEIRRDGDRLFKMTGLMSEDEWEVAQKALAEELRTVQDHEARQAGKATLNGLLLSDQPLLEAWEELPEHDKRTIVRMFIGEVEVRRDTARSPWSPAVARKRLSITTTDGKLVNGQ